MIEATDDARHVKLTEAITIKIDDARLTLLRGVAESERVEVPELIRCLIDRHLEEARAKHAALDRIFGADGQKPKGNEGNP